MGKPRKQRSARKRIRPIGKTGLGIEVIKGKVPGLVGKLVPGRDSKPAAQLRGNKSATPVVKRRKS